VPMTPQQTKDRLLAADTNRAMIKIGQNVNTIFNGMTLINRQAEVLFALLVFDHDETAPVIVYTTNVPDEKYFAGILRAQAAKLAPIPLVDRLKGTLNAVNGIPGMENVFDAIVERLQVMEPPVEPPPAAA